AGSLGLLGLSGSFAIAPIWRLGFRRKRARHARRIEAAGLPWRQGRSFAIKLAAREQLGDAMGEFALGQPVSRFEDPRLLRGGGRYVDDIVLPGMAFGTVLRSPHAHA